MVGDPNERAFFEAVEIESVGGNTAAGKGIELTITASMKPSKVYEAYGDPNARNISDIVRFSFGDKHECQSKAEDIGL